MHNNIKDLLLGEESCSIGKIGSIELFHISHLADDEEMSFLGNTLAVNAGINGKTKQEVEYWAKTFCRAISNLDVILAWNNNEKEEKIIAKFFNGKYVCEEFTDIEPFFHGKDGWHYALKDKKVLVVSSFKDSIESQLANYSKIWEGAEIGSCEVIKCPQPHQITGEDPSYFLENIKKLGEQISEKDFDICIIGAGGYSLPLCHYVKFLGKRAIHLGGATQVLFGIRGNRFDRNFADQDWYGTEHFISPLESDIPKFKDKVEEACYW
ncbi:hypothetical protein N9955_00945 [bacterium]|nr:hypothetical protein [bacterium]